MEGIRPVFESLLKVGVIVPCADSPVRTPENHLNQMTSVPVQDLQAVNASVKQQVRDGPFQIHTPS